MGSFGMGLGRVAVALPDSHNWPTQAGLHREAGIVAGEAGVVRLGICLDELL